MPKQRKTPEHDAATPDETGGQAHRRRPVLHLPRLRLPGMRLEGRVRRPAASPGIEQAPEVDVLPTAGAVTIARVDLGETTLVHDLLELELGAALDAFVTASLAPGAAFRWLDVVGLHPFVINRLRQLLGFHTLAGEDVLHVPQRAKFEDYEGHAFVVAHMLSEADGALVDEQVSFVLLPGLLLTFQERPGDVWAPVRERLRSDGSRLRQSGPGYLLYALVDALVDHAFPLLEARNERLEGIELRIAERAAPGDLRELHGVKRELLALRRTLWPLRQAIDDLRRADVPGVDRVVRDYLRDVHDHAVQAIEIIDSCRELAGGLTDLYMSSVSNRMNEIMKVLTIMASLFIPITFLAGVYGMNFHVLPELAWPWAYGAFWAICLSVIIGMLVWFRRKGWLGGER